MGNFTFVPQDDFNQTQVGKIVQTYVFAGGIPVPDIFPPQHYHSINNHEAVTAERQYVFINGLDSFLVTSLAYDDLVADTDFLIVKGFKIFFGVGAGKIAIGADDNATATNVKNFLHGYKGLTATVTGAAVTVKGYGKRVFDPLLITSSKPAAVSAVDDTANTGVASIWDLLLDGDLFLGKSQNRWVFPLPVDGKADNIVAIGLTPSNISTGAELVTALKAFIKKVHNATGIANAPTEDEGLVYSQNKKSYAQIGAALKAAFGTDPDVAYTITGTDLNVLRITYGTKGTIGNSCRATFGIWPEAPDIDLSLGIAFEPIIGDLGPGIPLGPAQAYNNNDTTQTATVAQDGAISDYGSGLTGSAGNLTVTLNNVHNEFNQRFAAGAAAVAADAGRNYVYSSAGKLEIWGFVAVVESGTGQRHLDITPRVLITGGLSKELTKASTKGITVTGAKLTGTSIASQGFSAIFRQNKQV